MEAKLIVVGGKAKAEQFDLKLPAIVGRSRSADLPLNHPLVSRQHCELFEADGQLMVRDLGSLNGTFVGDNRVTEEVVIVPGGHLTVGSVTFEAVYEAPPSADGDEAPDFEIDGDASDNGEADLDQTIDVASGKRAPAEKPAPAASESDAEDFDMNWLEEGAEDDVDTETSAPNAHAPDDQADLTAPLDMGDQVVKPTGKPPIKPAAAAKAKPSSPPPKKPAAKPAAADEDDIAEFAPAEGKKAEGEGGEDLDDFFRSLSEP